MYKLYELIHPKASNLGFSFVIIKNSPDDLIFVQPNTSLMADGLFSWQEFHLELNGPGAWELIGLFDRVEDLLKFISYEPKIG